MIMSMRMSVNVEMTVVGNVKDIVLVEIIFAFFGFCPWFPAVHRPERLIPVLFLSCALTKRYNTVFAKSGVKLRQMFVTKWWV
jgi:hypothetical protein